MKTFKTALESLDLSLQKLEDAVVLVKNKRIEDSEKITSLHEVIVNTYTQIDHALSHLKNGDG